MTTTSIPSLYLYNPTCDMAIENGTRSYMPPTALRCFEKDIAPILFLLANPEDYVIGENSEMNTFLSFWGNLGFKSPRFISKEMAIKMNKTVSLKPWGWSQVVSHQFKNLACMDFEDPHSRRLLSRISSVDIVSKLNSYTKATDPFLHLPPCPDLAKNFQTIEQLYRKAPNGLVLKTNYSSSGRGLAFIKSKRELQNIKSWALSKIKQHGCIISEPLLNKVQDASLQFNVYKNSIDFLGLNYFDADDQGRFSKEYLNPKLPFMNQLPSTDNWLKEAVNLLRDAMTELEINKKYQGPIGVDALFFKDKNDTLQFHPCIEANIRCNMGLLNLHLNKRIHPDSSGTWQIQSFKKGTIKAFFNTLIKTKPVIMEEGLIKQGFIPLTPYSDKQQFAAWGIIEP